jgi:DNA-binding response OmpR family regulator
LSTLKVLIRFYFLVRGEYVGYLKNKKILVIDDDPNLVRLIEYTFSKIGTVVYTAESGEEGLRQFYARQPDLIILDVMMASMDGWEVCARIRQVSDIPIIFLTALDGEDNIVRGLDCGAIDYMVKPFGSKVLVARAQAALRQAERTSGTKKPPTYRDDYLTVDLDTRRVFVRGEPVKLTATEYHLLAYLLQHAGQVLTSQQILENVWGPAYEDCVNYVHVYMWHLRNKLEEDPKAPCYLVTEHGVGYQFREAPFVEAS